MDSATIDDNDDDFYPVVKITCAGELPEGTTENGNEDTDDNITNRKTKI